MNLEGLEPVDFRPIWTISLEPVDVRPIWTMALEPVDLRIVPELATLGILAYLGQDFCIAGEAGGGARGRKPTGRTTDGDGGDGVPTTLPIW